MSYLYAKHTTNRLKSSQNNSLSRRTVVLKINPSNHKINQMAFAGLEHLQYRLLAGCKLLMTTFLQVHTERNYSAEHETHKK